MDAAGLAARLGTAVIVIHEVPGLHPLVVRFADRVVGGGDDGVSAQPVRRAWASGNQRLYATRRC